MPALLPRLFGDVGDWFEEGFPFAFASGQLIRVEDRVTDNEYLLRAELPGLDPDKDVQITTARGVLTIFAERREEPKAVDRTEFRYGALHRSVRLPAGADEEHVSATYRKGILEVTVPLAAPQPSRRKIPVTGP
jgi:HSP20 family protein